jgi:glycosyltransferase involved in cell wall biosynthesis
MANLKYDEVLIKKIGYKKIKYGILYGNEKIIFIKVGTDGNVRGCQDKYIKMAHRVHDRIGATVICASNPYITEDTHIKADKLLINKVISEQNFENYEMYFVGNSDGGYHSLLLAQQFSQTSKYLGINSSHKGIEDFAEIIKSLPQIEKYLVYGRNDEDFDKDFPTINALVCDKLEIILLDGVDHDFTGRVDDFIALIDLI